MSDGQLSSIDQGQQHKVPGRSAWFLFGLSTVENLVFLVLKRPAELGVADASGSVGRKRAGSRRVSHVTDDSDGVIHATTQEKAGLSHWPRLVIYNEGSRPGLT